MNCTGFQFWYLAASFYIDVSAGTDQGIHIHRLRLVFDRVQNALSSSSSSGV